MIIKNLVFDLDGTLLNSEKKITPELEKELKELKKNGMKIFIATGRAWFYAQEFYDQLELDTPLIACNGSFIKNISKNEVIFNETVKEKIAHEIFDYLKAEQINFLFYSSDSMYLRLNPGQSDSFIEKVKEYKSRKNVKHQFEIQDFDKISDESVFSDINKILLLVEHIDPEKLLRITEELRSKYKGKLNILSSQTGVLDIMPKNCDKGMATLWMDQNGYLNLSETVAFGDAHNDVLMLQSAKFSVGMNDGVDEIKEFADFIVDHKNNGIYDFLKHDLPNID